MKRELVSHAFASVEALPRLALADWDLLVRQARSAQLLGRLAVLIDEAGLMEAIPHAARAHLQSSLAVFEAQANAVRREVDQIARALAVLGQDFILLKGAAYLLAGLPAAKGRLFSDTDILVPRESLPQVEATLMLNGWVSTHHHPYDQRYYREWMHELPPMQHVRRGTVLDVHHAIVPPTATRLKPDSAGIIAQAQPLAGRPGLRVLAPADMVLHSATHLFYNEEFSHGMRDLSDMDLLLRHYGSDPNFWPVLVERSRQLTLDRPLYYCVRHAVRTFGTPVPASVLQATAPAAPVRWAAALMDGLWQVALRPPHPSLSGPWDGLAAGLLYLRAHWERMPLPLLTYHIMHKAFRGKPAARNDSPKV